MNRYCKKCGLPFSGVRCMPCNRISQKAYRENNVEKVKQSRDRHTKNNPSYHKERSKKYRDSHPEKTRESVKKYALKNKESTRLRSKEWSKLNKVKKREANARYREKNKEYEKARQKKWRQENPDSNRVRLQNRRARKMGNGGKLSIRITHKLLKIQKGLCACCYRPLGNNFHRDHIMPLALGGENIDSNIQLLRARCNLQKKAIHPVDFMRMRGFLL